MTNRIEWDEPQPALRAGLVVERCVGDVVATRQSATLDDLKRACEAARLHVVEKGTYDAIVAKSEAWRKQGDTLGATARKHEARAYALTSEVNTLRAQLKVEAQITEVEQKTASKKPIVTCDTVPHVGGVHTVHVSIDGKYAGHLSVPNAKVTAFVERLTTTKEDSHLDMETLRAENATLRAQLDELRAKHNATVAAANRDIEAIRAELAAAKARLRRDEVPEDRATDEELVRIAVSYWTAGGGKSIETLALAVAARVRRERGGCLVGRLVAKGFGFWVDPPALVTPRIHEADVGTCSVGICGVAGSEVRVQPADVPATLARLAGLADTSPPLSGAI